jgi:accessory gene regulator protein AgrB
MAKAERTVRPERVLKLGLAIIFVDFRVLLQLLFISLVLSVYLKKPQVFIMILSEPVDLKCQGQC